MERLSAGGVRVPSGDANPPCVHAALPTSKTAHWDSHADRWNGLVEKRPVADEVAALFGFQVVGVGTPLTFRYIGGSRPGDIRTARPKELFQVAGYPGCYILADDLDLDDERVFRLDRIDWQP